MNQTGERWLHDSLTLIWFAVRVGDPQMRRQAAVVCRALLDMLEEPPIIPMYTEPMYPPMYSAYAPPPAAPQLPRIDFGKLVPYLMPVIKACMSGDWGPLLELVKPLVGPESGSSAGGFQVPFVGVPGAES